MKGEVAQLVALCLRTNAYIPGKNDHPKFATHSTTQFCRSVEFSYLKKGLFSRKMQRVVMSRDANDWWSKISKEGLQYCYLSVVSRQDYLSQTEAPDDWKTSAFVGGGSVWVLTTVFDGVRTVSWVPIWKHTGAKQPWDVTYQGFNEVFTDQSQPVDVATSQLEKALVDIRDFARELKIPHWPDSFARALAQLTGKPAKTHTPDLIPDGLLSPEAENLALASQAAWVFGGMGTWNDIYETGHPRYSEVSRALFDAVNQGLVSATNSSAHSLIASTQEPKI